MLLGPKGPGPGAYNLPRTIGFDKHDIRKRRGPQYSFGINSRIVTKGGSPGPGAYSVEKINRYGNSGAPKYSIRSPIKTEVLCRSPGPATINLDKKPFLKGNNAPAYSLRSGGR